MAIAAPPTIFAAAVTAVLTAVADVDVLAAAAAAAAAVVVAAAAPAAVVVAAAAPPAEKLASASAGTTGDGWASGTAVADAAPACAGGGTAGGAGTATPAAAAPAGIPALRGLVACRCCVRGERGQRNRRTIKRREKQNETRQATAQEYLGGKVKLVCPAISHAHLSAALQAVQCISRHSPFRPFRGLVGSKALIKWRGATSYGGRQHHNN